MKRYNAKVKSRMLFQKIFIVFLVVLAVLYIVIATRPKIKIIPFNDECGRIGNTISHTIGDQETCDNVCRARCGSEKLAFHKSQFMKEPICHNCTCYCKKSAVTY